MLLKTPLVTVIPGVAGRDYRAASHVCYDVPPPGVGGDGVSPPAPAPPGSTIAPDGTPIILEDANGLGGYNTYTGVAPAPPGFVCRFETIFVTDPADPTHTAVQYNIVCTRN
jgi:hypothetical protein